MHPFSSAASGCVLLGVATLLVSFPLGANARSVRDVSHLEYLPPLPSRDYLPPLVDEQKLADFNTTADINNEYLPPTPNNEYLPPGDVQEVIEQKEEHLTEEPSTTTIATTTTTDDNFGESRTDVSPIVTTEEAASEEHMDAKQDTAVLLTDGYHYKSPEVAVDLFATMSPVADNEALPEEEPKLEDEPEQPQGEYLPPLQEGVVVATGPANQETSVLADDGYHYRAIKRLRF